MSNLNTIEKNNKKNFIKKLCEILYSKRKIFFKKDKVLFVKYSILGIPFYTFRGYKENTFYWADLFYKYFKENNMTEKVANLKNGLDKISCDYVDMFMENSKTWNKWFKSQINFWTDYDLELIKMCEDKGFIQPFYQYAKFNPFIFHTIYGLKDLGKEIFSNINGKDIIDAGGLYGDTAVLFSECFPLSKTYVYEPVEKNFEVIQKIIKAGNLENIIIPICKGLSDINEKIKITFIDSNVAELVPLDTSYNGENLGLIKIDTEGFESKIIEGAKNLIKKYKPVLAVAIYHTPQDFFDLKDKILQINPNYKFMIRRSEDVIPCADLVLIAF